LHVLTRCFCVAVCHHSLNWVFRWVRQSIVNFCTGLSCSSSSRNELLTSCRGHPMSLGSKVHFRLKAVVQTKQMAPSEIAGAKKVEAHLAACTCPLARQNGHYDF